MIMDDRAGLPSASGGERWFNCPGSLALEAQAPPETPADETLQGQEIHDAKESDDFSGLDEEGRTIAEQLTVMENRALELYMGGTAESQLYGVGEAMREERLWIRDDKQNKVCSAKLDLGFISTDRKSALVIDYKTGYLRVTPAFKNIQMRIQALAIWSEYPRLERITTGIAQYRFRGSLDFFTYTREMLETYKRELLFNLWRTEQTYATRVPGPWCHYCRAKAFCPEAAAMTMLPAVPFGNRKVAKKDIPALVNELSIEQLAFIYSRKTMIENVLDAVSSRLKTFKAEDLKSVGYELTEPSAVREIPDIPKMWASVWNAQLGISLEEFQTCLKASVGAVESLVTDKLVAKEGITKKDAKVRAASIMEPGISMKPKSAMLKPLKGDQCLPATNE